MTVQYDIEQVIPHRGMMRLIDRLLACDEDSVSAEVRVPADALFGDALGVPAWVGVEYMAQTVAAWAGHRARGRGEAPSIGFLLGTRRYQAATPRFDAGAVLRVEARCELLGDNGLGMFACRILQGDAVLATANVSVFEPPNAAAYLESGEA
ncbi:hotdog family protein [Stenotrophomonas sp. HITSZ_GD]|uniref:hotdog family protein n=1 Tax=Stenotrophomonas sp. HITSZ_GD TaxID=3037248 RepID=UPI00240E5985|nr:hotdog family protein [Stenotrophomonas sp. HITSZ_GD]MDG2525334.1 hotdog family protein [Stenotrophomonas sp. HITSZ_GD]